VKDWVCSLLPVVLFQLAVEDLAVVVHGLCGLCVLGFGVDVFGRTRGLLSVHVAASEDFG